MPDLPAPEPPPAQVALRATVEALVREYEHTVSYNHIDRFVESKNRREAVYGWGTRIEPRAQCKPIEVWFDGLDQDIAIRRDRSPWWRRQGGFSYKEWTDLTDLDQVLADVTLVLRTLLSDYR